MRVCLCGAGLGGRVLSAWCAGHAEAVAQSRFGGQGNKGGPETGWVEAAGLATAAQRGWEGQCSAGDGTAGQHNSASCMPG
jgi:hypothetical protein